jgi:hypothetical protein
MKLLDAAELVLLESGKSMSVPEIFSTALQRGWITDRQSYLVLLSALLIDHQRALRGECAPRFILEPGPTVRLPAAPLESRTQP